MKDTFEPHILAFLCRWCSYAGADLAGSSRIQYPPNVSPIRVPCSGRVNPILVMKALHMGADAVLVSGCHPGDCHYSVGNYYARRRFMILKNLLEYMGLDPRRFQVSWCSAAEGVKYSQVVKDVVDEVRNAGPNRWAASHE